MRIAFGNDSYLDLHESPSVRACGELTVEPLDDPLEAARAALRDPLDFPPLRQVVVQGDRVTIALEEGLPQPAPLVAAVVLELLEAGVDPEAICVARSASDGALQKALPTHDLPSDVRERVRVVVHDAADRDQLCLLSISSSDEGIYLNRELVEADVVVPIGVARSRPTLAHWGIHGILSPTFADEATQQRYFGPRSSLSETQRTRRYEEAREVSWLLGTRLALQIVPGAGERIEQVFAGDMDIVEEHTRRAFEATWRTDVAQRAASVVAAIPGGRQQQTWTNMARAIEASLELLQERGTLVVCSNIRTKPGPAMRRAARCDSLEDAERQIQNEHTPDALAAQQINRAQQRAKIYLLSELSEETVQSLGMAYVATPAEIVRLVSRQTDCLVLSNAHLALPSVLSEARS